MKPIPRLDTWRSRLAAEMARQAREPFDWGTHDCAVGFAASVVEAITGVDLAADHRGKYSTPRGALGVLRKANALTLGDFVAQHLPEINPVMARVGDIGVVPSDGPIGQALCMVDASTLVVLTPDGHGREPRSRMIRAFRVGE